MANVVFNSATPCHLDGDRKVTINFLRKPSSQVGQRVTIYGYYETTPGGSRTQLFSTTHSLTANYNQSKTITVSGNRANTAMENAMANSASIPLYIKLVSDGDVWGEGELVVTSDVSGPSFSASAITEGNSAVQHILNGAYFLTTESLISVDTSSASANNYATIVKRTIVVDGQTFILTGSQTVQTGIQIPDPGDYTVTTMITDSRGFRKIVQQTITVKAYSPPQIYGDSISRLYNAGSTAHLEFYGTYSDLLVSGSHVNSVAASLRYRRVGTSTYTSLALTLTATDNSHFAYNGDLPITFDEGYAYDIKLYLNDALNNVVNAYTLPKATPVLALRDEKIGINNATPTCALDINGDVKINGNITSIGVVTTSSFNSLTTPGVYWFVDEDTGGYYMVEVLAYGNTIFQRETYQTGTQTLCYIRSKIGSGNWTNWRAL